MRPTPQTDAVFRLIRDANHPGIDSEHFTAAMEAARNGVEALERERDDLAAWKRSALAVDAQCDIQVVGKLLGVPLGHAIHPAIEPGIRALKEGLIQTWAALHLVRQQFADDSHLRRYPAVWAIVDKALTETAPKP